MENKCGKGDRKERQQRETRERGIQQEKEKHRERGDGLKMRWRIC